MGDHYRVRSYPYTPGTPYRCGSCGWAWPCAEVMGNVTETVTLGINDE